MFWKESFGNNSKREDKSPREENQKPAIQNTPSKVKLVEETSAIEEDPEEYEYEDEEDE